MDDAARDLQGQRLLLVEDEYVIAADIAAFLEAHGAEVVGPAGSIEEALELVEQHGNGLTGAVLDVNLHGEPVFPVAESLALNGVPYIFTTGYDTLALPGQYADVPRCEKPISRARLLRMLATRVPGNS